jgi:PIN domain nuclease of toxin-antitoxin system
MLAYLHGEPGADHVTTALEQVAAVSAANWAEVRSKLAELGQPLEEVTEHLEQQGVLGIGLVVQPLDEAQAREIANLRAATRAHGLSLGDRACLALAKTLRLPVLTAGRPWATLQVDVTVRLIR